MSIIDEEKLLELRKRFKDLDDRSPNFMKEVEEIINETLNTSVDKVGELVDVETAQEHYDKELAGMDEFSELKDAGVFEYVDEENKDLLAGIEDIYQNKLGSEEDELQSIRDKGIPDKSEKLADPEDILKEILEELEKAIEEKKKAIDEKIVQNEQMREKVQKREELRQARGKVNELHKKTKTYQGTRGAALNQVVENVIVDYDKQLTEIEKETRRADGSEIKDKELVEENKKLEEEKKQLDEMLQKIKDSYMKDTKTKTKLVRVEKQIDDIAKEITSDMKLGDVSGKARALYDIYTQNPEYREEIKKMLNEKTVTVQKYVEGQRTEEEATFSLADITNTMTMQSDRFYYMVLSSTEKEKEENQEVLQRKKARFNATKIMVETMTGRAIPKLRTNQEYIDQFKGIKEDLTKTGFFTWFNTNRRVEEAAKSVRTFYLVVEDFIAEIPETGELRKAYSEVAEILAEKGIKVSELPKEAKEAKKAKREEISPKVEVEGIDTSKLGETIVKETSAMMDKDTTPGSNEPEKVTGEVVDRNGNPVVGDGPDR